jgi:hypothetical protein
MSDASKPFHAGRGHQYTCLDLAGHSWTFSETIANVAAADWGGQLVSSGAT